MYTNNTQWLVWMDGVRMIVWMLVKVKLIISYHKCQNIFKKIVKHKPRYEANSRAQIHSKVPFRKYVMFNCGDVCVMFNPFLEGRGLPR